jgi:uncharacterized membrane protein
VYNFNNILPLYSFVNNFFENITNVFTSLNNKLKQYYDHFLSKYFVAIYGFTARLQILLKKFDRQHDEAVLTNQMKMTHHTMLSYNLLCMFLIIN